MFFCVYIMYIIYNIYIMCVYVPAVYLDLLLCFFNLLCILWSFKNCFFWIQVFCHRQDAKIFYPSLWLAFYFLNTVFHTIFKIFHKDQHIDFFNGLVYLVSLLHFLIRIFKICVIYETDFDVHFVSSECIFPRLFI